MKALAAAARTHAEEEPLQYDDEVWDKVAPMAGVLYRLMRNPFANPRRQTVSTPPAESARPTGAQPAKHPQPDEHAHGSSVEYYVRELCFPTVEDLQSTLIDYAINYPADLPWTLSILQGLGLGASILSIIDKVGEACAFVSSSELRSSIGNILHRLQHRQPRCITSTVSLLYAGMTLHTAEHRQKQDQTRVADSRWFNFLKIAKQEPLVHTVLKLPLKNPANATAARVHPWIGRVESVLIDAIGGLGLNSARGGWRNEWCPNNELLDLARKALEPFTDTQYFEHCGKLDDTIRTILHEERAQLDCLRKSLRQQAQPRLHNSKLHEQAQLDAEQAQLDDRPSAHLDPTRLETASLDPAISDAGFAAVLYGATKWLRPVAGGLPILWVLKDVTREEL